MLNIIVKLTDPWEGNIILTYIVPKGLKELIVFYNMLNKLCQDIYFIIKSKTHAIRPKVHVTNIGLWTADCFKSI